MNVADRVHDYTPSYSNSAVYVVHCYEYHFQIENPDNPIKDPHKTNTSASNVSKNPTKHAISQANLTGQNRCLD
jgi:hypothetical protein